MTDPNTIDRVLDDLALSVRNNTVDGAAQVAALYGAPKEAVDAILRLKGMHLTASAPPSTESK